MPAVSIIISVYNGEQTLVRAFQSIFDQSFQDFEVICVNDGSTDGSSKLLEIWQERYPEQLRIVNNHTNIGLTRSLNLALSKATGTCIARLDADDFWEPRKLEMQMSFLETHPECGIVGSNYINISGPNDRLHKIRLPETHAEITRALFRRNPFGHSCILAKADLFKAVGGYDERIRYGQDYDLWLRCFPLTRFHNLQEFLCTRTLGNNLSIARQNAQMLQSIKTRFRYIGKYGYGFHNYLYLLEPLCVILTPNWIKNLKRRYL